MISPSPTLDRIGFFESVEYAPSKIVVALSDGESAEAQAFATTKRATPDEAPGSFDDWRVRVRSEDALERRD